MPILTLDGVSLAYGHVPLLEKIDLTVEPRERICLIGRTGTGKSTLFRIISGAAQADEGALWRREGLRISQLEQDVPPDSDHNVYDVVAEGLGELGALLAEYHRATHQIGEGPYSSMQRLGDLQQRIETIGGWNIEQKVETVISKLDLPADKPLPECSGGIRRRAMLAQALVSDPDLLLLDEPTNHMDIAAINWLEEFLLEFSGALLFITHDRTLLRHLATRIVELDRGQLRSFPGDFETYEKRKEQLLEAEIQANARFDKRLAEEEIWIRKGIKARRTRNEGRVRKLEALRQERAARITQTGQLRLRVDTGQRSGKLVADLQDVTLAYDGHTIVRDFSTRILRGDRVGIIGPNGCGKTTLLKTIVGDRAPNSGQVVQGTKLEIAYFDQQRSQLDLDKTVRENIGDGADHVTIGGRSRHVVGYLRQFLFPAQRIDSPVKTLSGGERNRLLLAKLFTRSANMMVLDEPTNDLDVDTLELLEDLLSDYDGTLLLVSHDRSFLDNVVTGIMVFEGEGRVGEYVGGYESWQRQCRTAQAPRTPARTPSTTKREKSDDRRRLSYKQQRELDSLPSRIEMLESEQNQLQLQTADANFYRGDKQAITAILERLEQVHEEIASAYERWEHLARIAHRDSG